MYDIIRIIMTLKKMLVYFSRLKKISEKIQYIHWQHHILYVEWVYGCRKILRIISFTLHERNPFFVMPFLCRKYVGFVYT